MTVKRGRHFIGRSSGLGSSNEAPPFGSVPLQGLGWYGWKSFSAVTQPESGVGLALNRDLDKLGYRHKQTSMGYLALTNSRFRLMLKQPACEVASDDARVRCGAFVGPFEPGFAIGLEENAVQHEAIAYLARMGPDRDLASSL